MSVSVIMPMDRPGPDALRAVRAILSQATTVPFELIVISGTEVELEPDPRLRVMVLADRNPARRRNVGAQNSQSHLVAFIDDDAFAEADWIEVARSYLEKNLDVVALGGPDPAPADSPPSELISETLLATRWIGSGVLCHENRQGVMEIKSPHDLALVNLFVRREAFERAGGFDESIGYIGEDTALIEKLLPLGRVVYHSAVVVRHRRRAFPGPYLRQRWRYRLKTGWLLVKGPSSHRRSGKVAAFLVVGSIGLITSLVAPQLGLVLLLLYAPGVMLLAIPETRLPGRWWPAIAPAFLFHHLTYYFGIITGALSALLRK